METTCPRCNRTAVGWSMKRADVCSPKWWGECIREPQTIQAISYDHYSRREN